MGKQLLASQDILVQRGFRVARVALQGASIGTRCLRPVTHLDVDITEIDQLLIPGRVLSCRRGISFPCQSQIVARFARTQRHKGIAMPKLSLVITPRAILLLLLLWLPDAAFILFRHPGLLPGTGGGVLLAVDAEDGPGLFGG